MYFSTVDDVITYYTSKDNDIFAPMEGEIKKIEKDTIKLRHEPDGCNSFDTIITNIEHKNLEEGDVVDGVIGKAKGPVTLTILNNNRKVKPAPYFDGTYCKKENKKEQEKEKEKTTSNPDITYDPYAIAAAPFYAMKLGKAGFKKLFTEEINRIKNLMK